MVSSTDLSFAAPADPRGAHAVEVQSSGQRHDRTVPGEGAYGDAAVADVSIGHKMLSAVTGSILTSILGETPSTRLE